MNLEVLEVFVVVTPSVMPVAIAKVEGAFVSTDESDEVFEERFECETRRDSRIVLDIRDLVEIDNSLLVVLTCACLDAQRAHKEVRILLNGQEDLRGYFNDLNQYLESPVRLFSERSEALASFDPASITAPPTYP